ncbi:hypothetical protein [Streptomyces lunaelactis]|uniref:hypothetical protein n=1 Tax=Streptomyces lunaelactis TaxID=1535768 RepID=UPI0015857C0A|nr:hypothetical protein [Streptomyces lunaelactis]NUL21850.1 hypothetical protein [Streptomyces lunaelactis]
MTTKNLSKSPEPEAPATEVKTTPATSADVRAPMETITLSHHLNIGGTAYLPGAKVRVSADYARRLRLQGYVART